MRQRAAAEKKTPPAMQLDRPYCCGCPFESWNLWFDSNLSVAGSSKVSPRVSTGYLGRKKKAYVTFKSESQKMEKAQTTMADR